MPFFGAEYTTNGYQTPCCLMSKSSRTLAEVQQDFLNNIQPTECNSCWNLEQQGLTSDRQLKNSSFDFYSNQSTQTIIDSCKQGNFSQQIIKLYTSNLCNSTCVTCCEEASSSWAALKDRSSKVIKIHNDQLNQIDYKNVTILSFVGGEPLYEKENFRVLEKLLSVNNTKCSISFVTNGSVGLTKNQIDILSKFSNLNFCISVDGIGPVFEYLRFPLKWDTILSNLNIFKSLTDNISFSYTISNLNVLYFQETINWFNENNYRYNYNLVSYPLHFKPNALPDDVKQDIIKKFPETMSLLSLNSVDSVYVNRLLDEIKYQDKLKNISITNYLPELCQLLKIRNNVR